MAAIHNLKRRLKSVKNTKQITSAMKLVAAAKLKKSQDRVYSARPYAKKLLEVIRSVSSRVEEIYHPLLTVREEKKVKVVVVTADKGLCGSFNSSVIKRAFILIEELEAKGCTVTVDFLGRKGIDAMAKHVKSVDKRLAGIFNKFQPHMADEVAEDLIKEFIDEKFDAVYFVYNEFKSVIQQNLLVEKLLPIAEGDLQSVEDVTPHKFEPSAEVIFDKLLPAFVRTQVYRMMVESIAAEFAARMTAMEAATKNASEMIDKLTLTMNKIRQAAITTEIIEVVSGGQVND